VLSYAYIHCKPDGVPFYVGKGAFRRAKHLGNRNGYHQATVKKYGKENILIGMLECSSSKIALSLEIGLIKCLKRMGIKLTNFTDGGEGTVNPCEESRKRMSEAAKKRGVSKACQEAKVKAKSGKPLSADQKAKQSAAMTGKVFTEEHRRNISISAKNRGVSKEILEKAWAASRARVQSEEERIRRGVSIKKNLENSGKTSKIKIDGVFYISLSEAARQTGILASSLLYGLRHSGYVKGKKVEYAQ
jgi:hypothetical protein